FFSADGTLVPTPEEAAQQAIQRAEAETQRAEAEAQRAIVEQNRADAEARRVQKLMEQLRALGVEPEVE
ncbi:MAG TPA: Uma2 family endonuclease, partial [Acidobacteriota bacterium]|nr:Uma2 family endonuclease [Acidobacteriota bacterium]